ELASAQTGPERNDPTFIPPDFAVPTLKPYDLTGTGMDYFHELKLDPALPDLTEYEHPRGLDIQGNTWLSVDPQLAGLRELDNPMGLSITNHPLLSDPLLPDLQIPEIRPEVEMPSDERPGELAPTALHVMDPATS